MEQEGLLTVEAVLISDHVNAKHDIGIEEIPFGEPFFVKSLTHVRCGSTVDHGIYALDTFVPLIELDQEERCLIRQFDPERDQSYSNIFKPKLIKTLPLSSVFSMAALVAFVTNVFTVVTNAFTVIFQHPTTWRTLQAIYILIGWLLASVMVVMVSNALGRRSGRE